jgi:tRNA(His) 5'-end guanylyltransferase
MTKDRADSLGDRLKEIEGVEANRKARKGMPIMARLDGRGFHNFTKGLQRPYHPGLSELMVNTTKHLVDEFQAIVGYCQSDEISLCWYSGVLDENDYGFNGRYQKFCSLLAASASVYFNKHLAELVPEKADKSPTFDCRVWQPLDLHEAYLNFLWREQDATKNAITMAAHVYYPHGELQGVNGSVKQEMLFQKGINFNDYPAFFKRGTYVARRKELKQLSAEVLAKIPEQHRPTTPVERSCIVDLELPPMTTIANPIDVLFNGQNPVRKVVPEAA